LALYIKSSTKLKDLSLSNSKLGDIFGSKLFVAWLSTSTPRGTLDLSGNLLGRSFFGNTLEDLEES
jgi:hypothetical protein